MNRYTIETPGAVAKTVEKTEAIKQKITTRAKGSLDVLVLVVICLLKVLFNFVAFGVNDTFHAADIIHSSTDILVTVFVFYVFIPSGKTGRMSLNSYTTAFNKWQATCEELRKNCLQAAFRLFCKTCSKNDDDQLRERQFERLENLGIALEEYEKRYKKMSRWKLWLRQKGCEISKAARKQIIICRNIVDSKPYNPDLILDGTDTMQIESGLKEEDKYENFSMALKPVTCVLTTAISEIVKLTRVEVTDPVLIIVSVLMTAFSISLSAYMGYKLGWNCIAREERYIIARTSFISRFMENHKKGTA